MLKILGEVRLRGEYPMNRAAALMFLSWQKSAIDMPRLIDVESYTRCENGGWSRCGIRAHLAGKKAKPNRIR
jgi:hypothetical protein